jgi:hypothetical protein
MATATAYTSLPSATETIDLLLSAAPHAGTARDSLMAVIDAPAAHIHHGQALCRQVDAI